MLTSVARVQKVGSEQGVGRMDGKREFCSLFL